MTVRGERRGVKERERERVTKGGERKRQSNRQRERREKTLKSLDDGPKICKPTRATGESRKLQ